MLKPLKLLMRVLTRASHALALTMMLSIVVSQARAGQVTNLFNFDLHNTSAGVVQGKGSAYAGYVYGTTADVTRTSGGTIFRVSITGGAPEVIHQFTTSEGYSPRTTLLVASDGAGGYFLYGTTHNSSPVANKLNSGGGTVFRVRLDGSEFQTLHDFGGATSNPSVDDSIVPDFDLVEDATNVYGLARLGGANHTGLIYRINKSTLDFLPLKEFGPGTLNSAGGYQPTPSGEGLLPSSSLVVGSDNRLYGATSSGGSNAVTTTGPVLAGAGTVYVLNADGSGFETLASFNALDTTTASPARNTTGVIPAGALIELPGASGRFVGTTTSGGAPANSTVAGYGTVFLLDATVSPATIVPWYAFDSTNGANPSGRLVIKNQTLYGITTAGSANSIGNIFALTYNSSNISTVPTFNIEHAFAGGEGIRVNDGLTLGTEGDLYAATAQGGACTSYNASGYGAVLRYSFNGAGYNSYANCTNISSGGGAFQMPWLWLLGILGLVPPARRWIIVRRS